MKCMETRVRSTEQSGTYAKNTITTQTGNSTMKKTAASTEIFENLPVPQALMKMAIPTIFAQIIVLIYNMADTFYLGRIGDPYMVAGASLILPIFNICLALSGLAGIGGGAVVSRLLGKKREEEASKVTAFCFYLAICVAAAFSLTMFLFMDGILRILGASDRTIRYAAQYSTCVIVLGAVPTVLSNVMANHLRSTGLSKEAGFGIMAGGILNIFLDPLFMFVLLPKGNEILGVGIATLLSNCVACIYFFTVIYRIREESTVTFRFRGLPENSSILSIFRVGIPSGLAAFLFDMDYIVIDRLMSGYGDVALAAIGIVLKVERLPLNTGIGLCHGMMPIVAYNSSAGNYPRMKETIRDTILAGLAVGVFSIVLYEIFAPEIMHIFITDAETAVLGTGFLRVRILATPLMFSSFFTVYVFQGFGEGHTALFLGVTRWLVFNIPLLFILNAVFRMYGIVWAQVAGDLPTVVLSAAVYRRYMKKQSY